MRARKALSAVAFFAACTMGASQVHAVAVDLELQLLVDVSGSVNDAEFALQRGGYAAAFANGTIQTAITNGLIGSIAVQMIDWSSEDRQMEAVPWTLVDSVATANALSAAILAATRQFTGGSTAVQSALDFGHPLFAGNGFDGTRLVIDISGDGSDNDSPGSLLPTGGRDNALAVVDSINAVVIGGSASVLTYYTNNVIGGTDPFVLTANDFAGFSAAIEQKLLREITGGVVPEPGTLLLLGAALVGLGFARKRLTI